MKDKLTCVNCKFFNGSGKPCKIFTQPAYTNMETCFKFERKESEIKIKSSEIAKAALNGLNIFRP